jgi:mono/diheme cytochrome c family protein
LYAAVIALLAVALLRSAHADVTGSYTGEMKLVPTSTRVAVAVALAQAGAVVSGTFTVTLPGGGGSFRLAGRARGRRLVVTGVNAQGGRLRWRGHVTRNGRLRGRVRLRGPLLPHAGVILLARAGGGGPVSCGSEHFVASVMTPVMETICARCHVAGGAAAAARFRVTIGDAAATETSALAHVDTATPSASRILLKPLGQLGHGGGPQIAPGSAEQQALDAWVALLVQPGCGGGGGGHPTDGAGLWGAYCASCHGADARGLDGRPDVHCSKQIADPVRNGRTGPVGDMPAFPELTEAEIGLIQGFLETLCPTDSASGPDLYAGNCAGCHGGDAGGGTGDGVRGPDIRCKGAADVEEKIREGDGEMPAFPELSTAAVARIADFVAGLCVR